MKNNASSETYNKMKYRLQRKEQFVLPNILGNRSMPVYTYRWKDIAIGESIEALESVYPTILKVQNGIVHIADGYNLLNMETGL